MEQHSDALEHAPSFDQMVGLIEKNFRDFVKSTNLFTEEEIEEGWQRYKTLNHLYRDAVEPDTLKRIEADANFYANLEIGYIGKISHAAGINQWEQTRDDYKEGATAEATRAAQREKELVEALAWYADPNNYLGPDGNLSTAWKNNMGKKAKEAINNA